MRKFSNMWIFITVYIALIYLSLPYMRSVLNFVQENIGGRDNFSIVINTVLLVIAIVFLFLLSKKITLKYFFTSILPILLVLTFIFFMVLPEERIHFIQYGILGFFVFEASNRRIVFTLLFVFSAGAIDEIIQHFLPNRVGDLRDVAMNAMGGALGLWIRKLL